MATRNRWNDPLNKATLGAALAALVLAGVIEALTANFGNGGFNVVRFVIIFFVALAMGISGVMRAQKDRS